MRISYRYGVPCPRVVVREAISKECVHKRARVKTKRKLRTARKRDKEREGSQPSSRHKRREGGTSDLRSSNTYTSNSDLCFEQQAIVGVRGGKESYEAISV